MSIFRPCFITSWLATFSNEIQAKQFTFQARALAANIQVHDPYKEEGTWYVSAVRIGKNDGSKSEQDAINKVRNDLVSFAQNCSGTICSELGGY